MKKARQLPGGLAGCNVDGCLFPQVHPHFSAVAEELLFYTSRYYHHTEQRLQEMGLRMPLARYQAQKLSLEERQQMAQLLALPASRSQLQMLGRALLQLGALSPLERRLAQQAVVTLHHAGATAAKETLPSGIPAADPLLNMAGRLHMSAQLHEQVVSLSLKQLSHFLDSANNTIRLNLWRATYYLHAQGFHLHNLDHDSGSGELSAGFDDQ
ncbi:MAG: hypothetical protein KZQ58_06870 [gamma proteobacterium symbiont of Bathyaustriella thionipta]|nr:hypothetical protein [gamma proteobacterium symbiont of Bathyaustriella thionipta]